MLTVLTPATETKLTTVERLQAELTDLSNAKAASVIAEASAAIVRYTGRPFAQEGYEETVAGYGGNYLMLSRTPVVGTPVVLQNAEPITDFTVEEPAAGILRRDAGWAWTAAVGWALTEYVVPNSEDPLFKVTYTAGYILPDDPATRDLPEDIERACIDLARAYWLARARDPAVASKRLGDFAISYVDESGVGGLPPRVEAILGPWVRAA